MCMSSNQIQLHFYELPYILLEAFYFGPFSLQNSNMSFFYKQVCNRFYFIIAHILN